MSPPTGRRKRKLPTTGNGFALMSDKPLAAHSLAEAYLYLMATPCGACGRGPLKGSDPRTMGPSTRRVVVNVSVTCGSCGQESTVDFELPGGLTTAESGQAAIVNPSGEPSRIIDVGQWILLFRMIIETASKETDKVLARHLGLEAAQCLQEALVFYDEPDSDLPPPESLFTEASRERFENHPSQFSKKRLIEMRGKLPSLADMRASVVPKKKRWWRRGRN